MKIKILSIFILFFFFSCSSDDSIEQIEEVINYDELNEIEIQKYIQDNNLNPQKSNTGLYYIIHKEGTGNNPKITSNVKVLYRIYNTNGITIDESKTEIDFDLTKVIKGFSEALTYLKEGGKGTFIAPSKLAYKNSQYHPLRYKVLVMDIELISIN